MANRSGATRCTALNLLFSIVVGGLLYGSTVHAYEDLKGLDFASVSFNLKVPNRYYDHIRSRAITQLRAAGLEPRSAASEGSPGLLLTLYLSEQEECKTRFFYERKLQLLELATFQRTERQEWFASWEAGNPERFLVAEKSLASLEADLAELINDFIYHFYLANPKKLKPGIRITPMPDSESKGK